MILFTRFDSLEALPHRVSFPLPLSLLFFSFLFFFFFSPKDVSVHGELFLFFSYINAMK